MAAPMRRLPVAARYVKFLSTASEEAVEKAKPKEKLYIRLGKYLKTILMDYVDVGKETLQDMKARPFKSAFILSVLGATGTLVKTNPDETSFHDALMRNINDMLLIGQPIKNKMSNQHLLMLARSYNEGRIKRMNLGVCSVMWLDNYDSDVNLYSAQCKHLRAGWLEMPDRTVDIGVFGHWLTLEKMMIDYDINSDEWPEDNNNKKD